jgi:hypothetical protein
MKIGCNEYYMENIVGATLIQDQGVWLMLENGDCEFCADENFSALDYYDLVSVLPTSYSYTILIDDKIELIDSVGKKISLTYSEMANFPKTIHRRHNTNIFHLNFNMKNRLYRCILSFDSAAKIVTKSQEAVFESNEFSWNNLR